MTGPLELSLIVGGVLVLASVLVSKISDRWGVPALLLFLALGMLAGSEGLGGIYFDDPSLANAIGIVCLALILFGGGLDTRWASVRPVLGPSATLATLGVVLTALLVALLAGRVFDLPWQGAFLVGAIISSTDAAAVLSILRSKGVSLRGNLRPLLELESGSNDPMAVFLTLLALQLLQNLAVSPAQIALRVVLQIGLGLLVGVASGELLARVLGHLRLGYEGLYPVFTLASALMIYAVTATLGGSGFLAVYVAGVAMARHDFTLRTSLMRFHDGVLWLAQIGLFLTLGLLVFPSHLVPLAGRGALIALWLTLVARPVAVLLLTLPFRSLSLRERVFVSWVGLRGAAPILLATYPLVAGVPQSDLIFNVVFFVVLVSVVVQGTTIPLVARWLRLDAPLLTRPSYPIEYTGGRGLSDAFVELTVPEGALAAGHTLGELNLPPELLVILIARENEFLFPSGGSALEVGDRLLVLADPNVLQRSLAHTGMIRIHG
ncbi:MAG: potassium/proton antiporter [Chloroflexi bacterium]|nr:potassium/proton antiporter [Chloroflexota bacterium]